MEALAAEVSAMEKYYHQSREYRQEAAALKDTVAMLEAQLAENQGRERDWHLLIGENEELCQRVSYCQAKIEEL